MHNLLPSYHFKCLIFIFLVPGEVGVLRLSYYQYIKELRVSWVRPYPPNGKIQEYNILLYTDVLVSNITVSVQY